MVNKRELESFRYDEGEIGSIADKALVVLSYLASVDGMESVSKKMADRVMSIKSEEEAASILNTACNALISRDPKDVNIWENVYKTLFENNLYLLENHFTPKDEKDAIDTVKKCIKEKKRIRTDLPEGSIA